MQYQSPGPFEPSRQGMCDFHNGLYFPTRALLQGTSPYGNEYAAAYPVARQIPFFSPAILVLHAPLALMPLHVGEVTYFVLSLAILGGITWLLASDISKPTRIDIVLAISAMLVFSRGGHITLFDGYFTFELVLATFLAIHWGDRRPWMAAIALAVVSAKPTYILPLGFLLLVRGNLKAIVIGAVISIVAAALPMFWLAWNEGQGDLGRGLVVLGEQISDAQEIHRAQPDESPIHSWTRLDLLAVVAKWRQQDPNEVFHLVVMVVLLTPALGVLHHRRRRSVDDGLTGLTGAVIVTTMLVSLYHQSYDALLLAAPLAGLLWCGKPVWSQLRPGIRWTIAAMLLVPLFNYISTRMILGWIDASPLQARVLTSINGVTLAIALAVFLWLGTGKSEAVQPIHSSELA